MEEKLSWQGTLISVQPRIRLMRSFDERAHTYLGYTLRVRGDNGNREGDTLVGIGKAAHAKHQFQAGLEVSGKSQPVADPQTEPVDFYKTSGLKLLSGVPTESLIPPPWQGVPPDLPTYRERGHRRLDTRTYNVKCATCIWGCRMAVEIIIDHWKPDKKRYRFEAFCYGPKSCSLYRAGSTRKVPGRGGMTWEEEDWIDQDTLSHRGEDD